MTVVDDAAPLAAGSRLARLVPRLACPSCRGTVRATGAGLVCVGCGTAYAVHGEMVVMLDPTSAREIGAARHDAENVRLRARLGRTPWLLWWADRLRPPHPFLFLTSRANRRAFSQMVAGAGRDPVFLDIGSGLLKGLNATGLSSYVSQHLVPLEIAPGPGIGIVGDAHRLPWGDGSVDGVLIQGVLEHVHEPERVVMEIARVLKPGAPVYAEVPFLQHFHLDPIDFRRYTVDGFEYLFRAYERVDSGVVAGPASALADMLTEFPALLFRSPALYWGAKVVSGWLTSPLKFLDILWGRLPRAHIAAGGVYFLGRRRGSINEAG